MTRFLWGAWQRPLWVSILEGSHNTYSHTLTVCHIITLYTVSISQWITSILHNTLSSNWHTTLCLPVFEISAVKQLLVVIPSGACNCETPIRGTGSDPLPLYGSHYCWHLKVSPPEGEKTCLRDHSTTVKNFTQIVASLPKYLSPNRNHRKKTRGQSNLTKSASRGAHSPVRGHPRRSKVVPLNSWGRVSY